MGRGKIERQLKDTKHNLKNSTIKVDKLNAELSKKNKLASKEQNPKKTKKPSKENSWWSSDNKKKTNSKKESSWWSEDSKKKKTSSKKKESSWWSEDSKKKKTNSKKESSLSSLSSDPTLSNRSRSSKEASSPKSSNKSYMNTPGTITVYIKKGLKVEAINLNKDGNISIKVR